MSSTKRYIVTEHDLQRLEDLASDYATSRDSIDRIQLFQARKVVRMHEFPEWATHFAGDIVGGYEFMQAEEISKLAR